MRRPVMVQDWTDVVFLHWPYDPRVVQRLLPEGVEVDTIAGEAWVSLVPFSMEGLGLPGLAPLPFVGAFPEVNVRTYVRCGARRGVWFFSLDIDRILPTMTARLAYRLPYCLGAVAHSRVGPIVTSRVERRWPHGRAEARTSIAVQTGPARESVDELDAFLTARWGLISASRSGRLRYAPVDHPAWPLHGAQLLHLDDRLVEAAGLPAPKGEPLARWSPGVAVRVGLPHRLGR